MFWSILLPIYIIWLFFPFVIWKWFETLAAPITLQPLHFPMQHSMMQWNLNNPTMYVYTKNAIVFFKTGPLGPQKNQSILFVCFSSRAINQRETLPNTRRRGQDTLLLLQAAVLPKWKSPGSTGLNYLVLNKEVLYRWKNMCVEWQTKSYLLNVLKIVFPDTFHQSKAPSLGKQLYSQSRQMYQSCEIRLPLDWII